MDMTQRDYDRLSKPPHDEWQSGERSAACYEREIAELREPRGLARLDHSGILELRAIILTVIDDGDPSTPRSLHGVHMWNPNWALYAADEAVENEQRLRFCDRIAELIVARTAPAAVNERAK